MDLREFALVAFTILAQMSAGSFLILSIVRFIVQSKAGAEQADQMSSRAFVAVVPVLALAMLASLFHLGNPAIAYFSVLNVGSAWLSREILFAGLFFFVGAAYALMQWKKVSTPALRNTVAVLAALLGLAMVFSMSRIYMMRTVPAWNTLATPLSFFTTTVLLGTLAVGAAFVANYSYVRSKDPDCAEVQCTLLRSTLRWLVIVAVVFLGIEFLLTPMNLAYLTASGGAAESTTVGLMVSEFGLVFALRLLLVFLGAGVLGLFVYKNASIEGQEKVMGTLTYAAFALVLVGEVLGRFLFYATFARIGI